MSGNDSDSSSMVGMMTLFGAGVAAVAAFCGSRVLTKPAVKEPRNKAEEEQVLKDYDDQMQTEQEELEEIIMQLNQSSESSIDILSRTLANLNNKGPDSASSTRPKELSKVKLPAHIVLMLEQKRDLHHAIKNYPDLDMGKNITVESLRNYCLVHAEHHQQVKTLAALVLEATHSQLKQNSEALKEQQAIIATRRP